MIPFTLLDADGDRCMFTLNERSKEFSIEKETGLLKIDKSIDYEADPKTFIIGMLSIRFIRIILR